MADRIILALRKNTTLLAISLLGMAVATPLLAMLHLPLVAFAIQRFFAVVCHELPERSFSIAGYPISICVRCFGIYCGAALGTLVHLPRKSVLQGLGIALLLNAVDVASETCGLHGNLPGMRLVLGLLLGMMVGATLTSSVRGSAQQLAISSENMF